MCAAKKENLELETVKNPELEAANTKIAELEARLKAIEEANAKIAELESKIKAAEASKPAAPVMSDGLSGKTVTLISEAKHRIFDVDPRHVVKIIRGAQERQVLQDKMIRIKPGSIVEFNADFAKFLLTYKTFKVYGV